MALHLAELTQANSKRLDDRLLAPEPQDADPGDIRRLLRGGGELGGEKEEGEEGEKTHTPPPAMGMANGGVKWSRVPGQGRGCLP